MAVETKIEWADHTWSPWRGCVHATLPDGSSHLGCLHCYAETMAKRNPVIMGEWGVNGTRVRAAEKSWNAVHKWNGEAADEANVNNAAESPRIFPSVCDPFEDWQGTIHDHLGNLLSHDSQPMTMADCRSDLFELSDETEYLTWILLTKRPQNIHKMWPAKQSMKPIFPGMPGPLGQPQRCFIQSPRRENVWLVYSASDQRSYDQGLPHLLDCRALSPVLGVCLGPLVGPVILGSRVEELDWVIIEGESGSGSRECNVAWIIEAIVECRDAGVPCYVKQLGANPRHGGFVTGWPKPIMALPNNAEKLLGIRHPKGGDMSEWPEDLRVRQFPKSVVSQ